MIAAVVIARGGRDDEPGTWLLIPLVVMAVMLRLSDRRRSKVVPSHGCSLDGKTGPGD